MKRVIYISLKIFVWFYHFSYHKISALAILENGGVHPKHRITNYHKFFTDNIGSKDVILDVGCGDGLNTYYISKKAKKVVGIDIIASRVAYAKSHNSANNIIFQVGDATKTNFNESFDKIVLSNVLEHLKNRVAFLSSLHRLSGTLLVRVPLISRDWLPVYLKEKGLDYVADPTHETEFTENSFQEEMESAKWKIKSLNVCFGEIWAVIH